MGRTNVQQPPKSCESAITAHFFDVPTVFLILRFLSFADVTLRIGLSRVGLFGFVVFIDSIKYTPKD